MNKHYYLGKMITATAVVVAGTVALSGCSTGGTNNTAESAAPTHLAGTVSLWDTFTGTNDKAIVSVIKDFEAANPDVKVKVIPGQADDKLSQSIATSSDIDVAISQSGNNVGLFCSSGALKDLTPYLKRDSIDMSQFSNAEKTYTSFEGNQCTLPMLSDSYGLYLNTDLMQSAGITTPPKTLSELESDALRLTTYNADGSIKVLGFNPIMGSYENSPSRYAPIVGATWLNKKGESNFADQAGWKEVMTWQKAFVDKIGYDKLRAFTAGLGEEFSGDNAFYTGQIAMMFDGDWRVAHIVQDKLAESGLHYTTAPTPTADDHTELYGASDIDGTVLGIAKSSRQPELAWALLKYLTTDTGVIRKLTNALKGGAPVASLNSPDLKLPAEFMTFSSAASNSHSASRPPTVIGASQLSSLESYWEKWQAGNGGDLAAGLAQVDKTVNNSIALSKGP